MTEFVPVPGGRLAYDATGDGPPIVLMHAWICDRRMWDDLVPLFARRHRVVRYDKRGFGETEISEPVRYSNRADVIAVLDHLGIDRATLVGVSGGSAVALDTAARAAVAERSAQLAGTSRHVYEGLFELAESRTPQLAQR